MPSPKVRWLLLADIHFKHQDLDRIAQTAAWIRLVVQQHHVRRVVVCGDLLTCRTSQPTHVLSACYRFLDSLVHDAKVAHVNVLLGNHDLAYRRDYATTALDALRLATPVVQVHRDIGSYVWDGRRVLTLPFREDQTELTDAVAALRPDDAAHTVAFAHLAIHRAITQRHIVRPSSDATSGRTGSVAYHGLIGPDYFSTLARTFTGHFHCHQTILQQQQHNPEATRLQGSVTYVGSPLQLTWADLWDEQRGVILLDPEKLDHELIVNPYAVGYITVAVDEVLGDAADPAVICGKHVMLLGDLTRFKYAAARDKLVSIGARTIRSWSPMAPRLQGTVAVRGLGASTPTSEASLQHANLEPENDIDEVETDEQTTAPAATDLMLAPDPPQPQQMDIREQAARYVEAVDLDQSLEKSRESLVQVGQRLLEAATSEQADEESRVLQGGQPETLDYKMILPSHNTHETGSAASRVETTTHTDLSSPTVFNAQPRSLTITNFLGVQSTIHLDFGTDIKRGLTFLVGENGSGKSTLVEAIVWCQFGRCLRSGLCANDVVNDKAKRDCSVRMEFDNGYAIERFRKHKQYGNRIIVERDGKVLPEFEKADARSTQAAIDELLGVSHDTFARTIVLGHESSTSFLSSTPAQRKALTLSTLGLEILDRCASTTRRLLRELDDDMGKLQSRLHGVEQTMHHVQGRIMQLIDTNKRVEDEFVQTEVQRKKALEDLTTTTNLETQDTEAEPARLNEQISTAQQQVDTLLHYERFADLRRVFEAARSAMRNSRLAALQHLTELEGKRSQLLSKKPVTDAEFVEEPETHTTSMCNWILDILTRMHQRLQSVDVDLSASLHRSSPSTSRQRVSSHLVKASLTCLRRVSAALSRLTGADARKEAKARREREVYAYQVSLEDTEGKLTEQRRRLGHLTHMESESHITQQVARDRNMPEHDVQDILQKMSADDAKAIPAQLNAALMVLTDYQGQRELHAAKQAKLRELHAAKQAKLRDLQAATLAKAEKVATYGQIIERESAARRDLEADRDVLQSEMATLAADRILLDFWASALAQKSRRVSSPTSSSSSSAISSYTFRQFVLEQSLAELNTVTTQILAIMFEHSRHGTALTTGMLRSLFVGDQSAAEAEGKDDGQDTSGVALDSSLSVDARLSYGKRSGGERKRIDLAVFFALRSPHRAHYMLIDEVFDSLDAVGQAAVVRWCSFMAAARVGYILVITHSEHLVSRGIAGGETEQEDVAHGAVLTARMGKAGVELDLDGKKVG